MRLVGSVTRPYMGHMRYMGRYMIYVSRRTQHLASTGSHMHRKKNSTIAGHENPGVFRYIVSTLSSVSFVLIWFVLRSFVFPPLLLLCFIVVCFPQFLCLFVCSSHFICLLWSASVSLSSLSYSFHHFCLYSLWLVMSEYLKIDMSGHRLVQQGFQMGYHLTLWIDRPRTGQH